MTFGDLFWIAYLVSIPFCYYTNVASFSTQSEMFLPRWCDFRFVATGSSLVGGFFVALMPVINWIVVLATFLVWLMASKHANAWFASNPLRKK